MNFESFDDIHRLIYDLKQEENILLDYKSGDDPSDRDGAEIAKDVSAFANQNGGHLIYGVRETNRIPSEINGVKDPEALRNKIIQSAASDSNLNPPIFVEPVILKGKVDAVEKTVIVVKVEESAAAPHCYRGSTEFWIRNADTSSLVKGSRDMMKLLENRRESMNERIKNQRLEAVSFSEDWLRLAYREKPASSLEEKVIFREKMPVPYLILSIQPRIFDPALLDIRKINSNARETVKNMQLKYKWQSRSSNAFFEVRSKQSYSLTYFNNFAYYPPRHDTEFPSVFWSALSSTGMIYHLQDMPLKRNGPAPQDSEKIENQFAFEPIFVLKRICAFLVFAKEYYSVCKNDLSFNLVIEFQNIQNNLLIQNERTLPNKHIIQRKFVIDRFLNTLDLVECANIKSIVLDDIAPELLVGINFETDYVLNEIERKQITEGIIQ